MRFLKAVNRSGSTKLPIHIILVLVFCGSVILTLNGGATAHAADNEIFDSAWGTFHNPDRPDDDLEIECLQYGTGDPATFDTGPAIQTEAAETLNQIRSGRIPDGVPIVGGNVLERSWRRDRIRQQRAWVCWSGRSRSCR